MIMAISAGISGAASLEDVGKMMLKSMAAVAAQLAIQWVSIAIINKTGGEAAGAAVGNGINAGLASTGVGLIIVAIGLAIGAIVLALGRSARRGRRAGRPRPSPDCSPSKSEGSMQSAGGHDCAAGCAGAGQREQKILKNLGGR